MTPASGTFAQETALGSTVLIPVRSLEGGKQRLAGVLTADERRLLVEAMLMDVIAAARSCDHVSRVVVVTDDDAAANFSRYHGALALLGSGSSGYCRSVDLAVCHLRESDHRPIIVVPADVPMVAAAELSTVAAAIALPGPIALVEAEPDGGTNCIGLSASAAINFQFGPSSFRLHVDSIRRSGQTSVQLHLAGLAFDIDWPEQIVDLARMPDTTNASRLARSLGIAARGPLSAVRKSMTIESTSNPPQFL
ncbi:2-phospho-L-lactate guanylyltransferase [Aminobacter niigataensis]|uniref:2-phospho-L-lactate guanylyltransferase n=1 Tax=Aminobacter niigataensis TaxID=83265 RepID=UPI0024CD5FAF|nr:2-phospho-L-lactate guanylyltransferase [Aminobacter niigataensis]CAI2931851.1 Phosphoenolpyruvate guanylyltransferase [Aminobacter niigataensis]